jgi:cupin fold WbuC family metalloprotein
MCENNNALGRPDPMQQLSQDLLNDIAGQSRDRTRLRQNYDFHQSTDRVQRFLNALQPGTYVRPHRHLRPEGVNGFEFFLVLEGAIGLLVMDAQGQVLETVYLSAQGQIRGVELAEGQYHSLVALAPNTVMLEIKEGPYNPATDKEFIDRFPLEETQAAQAQAQVHQWHQLFTNSRLPQPIEPVTRESMPIGV